MVVEAESAFVTCVKPLKKSCIVTVLRTHATIAKDYGTVGDNRTDAAKGLPLSATSGNRAPCWVVTVANIQSGLELLKA